jgi:hypothetical protein
MIVTSGNDSGIHYDDSIKGIKLGTSELINLLRDTSFVFKGNIGSGLKLPNIPNGVTDIEFTDSDRKRVRNIINSRNHLDGSDGVLVTLELTEDYTFSQDSIICKSGLLRNNTYIFDDQFLTYFDLYQLSQGVEDKSVTNIVKSVTLTKPESGYYETNSVKAEEVQDWIPDCRLHKDTYVYVSRFNLSELTFLCIIERYSRIDGTLDKRYLKVHKYKSESDRYIDTSDYEDNDQNYIDRIQSIFIKVN